MNKHAVLPVPVSQTRPEQPADLAIEGTAPLGEDYQSEPVSPHDLRQPPAHGARVLGTIRLKRPSADRNP